MSEPSSEVHTARVLPLLAAVVFVSVVNGTMINVALPHIGHDFGVSEGVYGWLITGYSLAFGVFNAINGKLADLWGLRRLYVGGVLVLGVCSLIVAASPWIGLAIAVRVVQGAGAAALPVLGATIIQRTVPPLRRGRAIGTLLGTVGLAASIGPFLGGMLVQFASWRVVFVLPGLVLLAAPLAWRLLPASLDESRPEPFDFVGAVLLGLGIAALVFGFSEVRSGATGLVLWGTLGLGVVALVAFGVWIGRWEHPFVSPALFRQVDYLKVCAIGFLTNVGRFGTVVLVPIVLTKVNQLEPIWVGVVLFPGALAVALLSRPAGRLTDARGPRLSVTIGLVSMSIGMLVSAWFAGGSVVGLTVGMTLIGAGFAFAQGPLVNTATQLVNQGQAGGGIGFYMMIFFVGGGSGVASLMTMIELQSIDAQGFFDLGVGAGGRFSNAMVVLALAAAVGALLAATLPVRVIGDRGPSSPSS